jgi:Flp pilus assembly protein TadG
MARLSELGRRIRRLRGGRLRVARRGAAGIEFALTAPLFLLLQFGILEVGLDSFTQAQLDDATHDAARQVAMGHDTTAASVVSTVCAKLTLIVATCPTSLSVYATSGTSFTSLAVAHPIAAGGLSPSTFTPGGANADVLLQVGYTRGFVFPYFGNLVGGNWTSTLTSAVAFQNEGF